jgi:hypothetical protein
MTRAGLAALVVAGCLWASVAVYAAKNGDFEKGIEHWSAQVRDRSVKPPKLEKLEGALTWEKEDAAGESKGALRVKLEGMPAKKALSHDAGAVCELKVRHPKGTKLLVTFDAKHIGGEKQLKVSRAGGGSKGAGVVVLTPEWKAYEVEMTVDYVT